MCDDEAARSFHITIKEGAFEVTMYITLPCDYPSQSPPNLELSAPTLSRLQKQTLALALNDVYLESIGESVLYQWIEKVRELLFEITSVKECDDTELDTKSEQVNENVIVPSVSDISFDICHGNLIQDRKSVFQGHATKVFSTSDVKLLLNTLKSNKKIAQATHNILAYRIKDKKTDCILQVS